MSAIELVTFRAYADLKSETQRTYLGFLWWILEPLLFLAVFYVVLRALQGRGGRDFVAFLLVGLVLWQWFKSAISHAANAVLANLYLLRQVRVAPWIFVATVVLADTVKFALLLVLLLAMLPLMGYSPGWMWVQLAPILVTELLLILGLGMVAASLVPFVPDLRFVIEAVLHALLFVSGVFFALDALPAPYSKWLSLNPIAVVINESRQVLLHGLEPNWRPLSWVLAVSVVLLAVGLLALRSGRTVYAKLPA
jgi:lipopolysaccharide transport system permease protein